MCIRDSNEVWGAFIPPQVPSAPRNLVATSGISYVVLNWEEPTSSGSSTIIRYDVYRGTTLGVSLLIGETAVGVLTYNDTAAVGGTSYHYQVVAVNAEGNSPESNDAQATPLAPQAPSAPRNLVADFGNAYVQLRWDAPTNSGTSPITGYAVLRGTSLGDISYLVDTTTAGVLNLNDTSVSNGVTYYYQVRAMNAVGGSPMSNTVTANPTGPMPPSVPREVTARGALTYVILNWTAPESEGSFAIIRYDIYRGTNASNVNLLVGSVAAGVLIYNDTSVASHFGYYYVVKAVNGVGPSAASNLAYTTTNEDQGPTQPRNLRAEAGNGFVKLQWDLPYQQGTQPIVRYYVYRGTSSSEIYTLVGWANAPLREFNDTSVLNGNTYFYAVVAASSAGNSGPSNTVQGTTSGPAVPSAPQNLLAQGRPGMVNLTWDASAGSGILRYDIFRGTSEGSISSTPIGNTASGLAYSDATITAGTVYFYKVKAVNSVGSSPYSNAANATATAALPGAPQNLVATPGAGKVTLTWAAPATSGGSAITGYKVYLALLGGAVNIANVSGSTLSYVDSTGTSGTTYTYYVVAVNAVGSGAVSGQASASPQAASAADNTMLYVGIAIAIIVVIAIVVMLMRRKK